MIQKKSAKPRSLGNLVQIGWLSEQPDELKDWFQAHGRWGHYAQGEILCREESPSDAMYGLSKGALDVCFGPDELEDAMMLRAHPGTWLGEGALLSDKVPRPIALRASADSDVLSVAGPKLRDLLRERPEFWPNFFSLSMNHSQNLLMFLSEALSLSPRARLARLLLRLSENGQDIRVSQQDLGTMIGAPRTTLQRALNHLTGAGAIRTGYNNIAIVDRRVLEKTASD